MCVPFQPEIDRPPLTEIIGAPEPDWLPSFDLLEERSHQRYAGHHAHSSRHRRHIPPLFPLPHRQHHQSASPPEGEKVGFPEGNNNAHRDHHRSSPPPESENVEALLEETSEKRKRATTHKKGKAAERVLREYPNNTMAPSQQKGKGPSQSMGGGGGGGKSSGLNHTPPRTEIDATEKKRKKEAIENQKVKTALLYAQTRI